MKRFMAFFVIFCFLSLPVLGFAAELSKTYMADEETASIQYLDKKSSKVRSTLTSTVKKIMRDGKSHYLLTQEGKGDFDKFENITWYAETEVEERDDGFLYPVYSRRILKNMDGSLAIKYEKKYDYKSKKINFTSTDGEGKVVEKKFPIKGKTVDDVNMVHFLKVFASHPGEKGYRDYFYISDEPKLYHMKVRDSGKEEIELPGIGKVNTVKLRLIIDLGLLTGVAGMVVPPTYSWYTDDGNYSWMQYEGLETNLSSPHIVVHVTK